MAFTTDNTQYLTRTDIWDSQMKDVLYDELMGMKYVRLLTNFPDGDRINIPSIGQMETQDYAEDQAIRYSSMDTGNFQFTISKYKASGTYMTEKAKQDLYYASQLRAAFVPKMTRAIMETIENDVLRTGPDAQTTADSNTINGGKHRFVGSGASETIALEDFAKAEYALLKANVPMTNLVGIVDPSVAYTLATQTNLVNLMTPQPKWQGIVNNAMLTGMKFVGNVYGFDLYVSHHLKTNTASETIDGVTAAAGVNNIFFSAAPGDTMPLIGVVRQPVKVDSGYNKDKQRDEWVVTCRYDFALYRRENFVTILTDTDQVYA